MIEIFKSFLVAGFTGTLLAIILTLLKPITKKFFSVTWHYYMWITVLIIMVFPLKLNIPKAYQKTPVINTPLYETNNVQLNDTPLTIVQPQKITFDKTVSIIEETKNYINNYLLWLSYIWLSVAIILMFIKLLKYTVLLRKIHRHSEIISCPEIFQYTKRRITARVSEQFSSPLIIGIIKPTLLLPKTSFSQKQLHNILAHEIIHLKRNDLLYKWFVSFVKCICWYNPAIYLIAKQINIDCEISCDLTATKNMNNFEKKSYMETILSLVTHSTKSVELTTGMASNKKILKKRFSMILKDFKFSKKIMIISAISAIIILGISVFASGILNGKFSDSYKNEITKLATDNRKEDVFNTLILGVDEQNRADTIMIVMAMEDRVQCVSIPRDTHFNGKKISEILSQENGNQKVIDTIREDLSIPITYYAKINMEFIKDLIDISGGKVTIDVPIDMKYDDPYSNLHIDLKKGKQNLDGKSVIELLRFRRPNNNNGDVNSDLQRIRMGQEVISQFISDNMTTFLGNSKDVINSISRNIVTNYQIENLIYDINTLNNKLLSFDIIPFKTEFINDAWIYTIDYDKFNLVYKGIAKNPDEHPTLFHKPTSEVLHDFFVAFSNGGYNKMKKLCTDDVWNTYFKKGEGFCGFEDAALFSTSNPTTLKEDNYYMYEVKVSDKKLKHSVIQTWWIYLEKQADGKYLIQNIDTTPY